MRILSNFSYFRIATTQSLLNFFGILSTGSGGISETNLLNNEAIGTQNIMKVLSRRSRGPMRSNIPV